MEQKWVTKALYIPLPRSDLRLESTNSQRWAIGISSYNISFDLRLLPKADLGQTLNTQNPLLATHHLFSQAKK
jgi:hypothetical protein